MGLATVRSRVTNWAGEAEAEEAEVSHGKTIKEKTTEQAACETAVSPPSQSCQKVEKSRKEKAMNRPASLGDRLSPATPRRVFLSSGAKRQSGWDCLIRPVLICHC
jgi:anti-sigma factor RsiW